MSHSPQSFRLSIWLSGALEPSGWAVEVFGQAAELVSLHATNERTFDPEEALDHAVSYVTNYITANSARVGLREAQPALPFPDRSEEGLNGRGCHEGHVSAGA